MAPDVVDRRDQEFVLHELLNVTRLSRHEPFTDYNRKTVDLILSEARHLAVKELLPTRSLADVENNNQEGCVFDQGAVKVPRSFHKPYKTFCDGGWLAMSDDPEYGGQGMPHSVAIGASELFSAGNMAFYMYPSLTHGAAKLIETFGTPRQKEIYIKNLFQGKWSGTMCLTEPEAGSDVGALTTAAVKNADGTYSITGNKIFISSGDNDMVENILHPVLARIEGAPPGTKGISLFAVPKYKINQDLSIGEPNDVVITGIEEKMGIHGNCTCSIAFGSKGDCTGTLIGAENQGMKAMFLMMNEARFGVALQGLANASASYMNAADYAKKRIQGVALTDLSNDQAKPLPIIKHPDVRSRLMWMKAYVDGMRAFVYYTAMLFDQVKTAQDKKEKAKYQGLIELLTPLLKAYCTDKGFDVCAQGIQIYGGYGYIKEYGQEQLLRDVKITSIYEGTNGIQAVDLLGRKLGMNNGRIMQDLAGEITLVINQAGSIDQLRESAADLEGALKKVGSLALHMGLNAMSNKVADAFASASPFLEVLGDVVMAWMLLWRADSAIKALEKKPGKKDSAFYRGQIQTARFFYDQCLPVTMGKMDAVKRLTPAVMKMPDEAFGG